MSVRFVNNFSAALTAGIDSDDTTLLFAAGVGDTFRAKLGSALGSDHVYITVYNAGGDVEYMKVTATTGDDFTVVRGQDNTTARAWLSGDMIACRPNAAALQEAVSLPTNLATSGVNLDITELRGLTTPLSVAQGGTGATTAATARASMGVAASGENTDIISLNAPALGSATATTQATSDDSTKVATTAFVQDVLDAGARVVAAFLFNGTLTGTNAPTKGLNVTSVIRHGVGNYTVNFTSALANTDYVAVVSAYHSASVLAMAGMGETRTTSAMEIGTFQYNTGTANDCSLVQGVVYALP